MLKYHSEKRPLSELLMTIMNRPPNGFLKGYKELKLELLIYSEEASLQEISLVLLHTSVPDVGDAHGEALMEKKKIILDIANSCKSNLFSLFMSKYPNCPKCGKNDDVKQIGLKTSSSFRVAKLRFEAVIMDLTTPIGKGASVDSARRLRNEASKRELQDYRYHCDNCNVDFEYNVS